MCQGLRDTTEMGWEGRDVFQGCGRAQQLPPAPAKTLHLSVSEPASMTSERGEGWPAGRCTLSAAGCGRWKRRDTADNRLGFATPPLPVPPPAWATAD
jgi:hypothetical protein